jgi:hypothetical protein
VFDRSKRTEVLVDRETDLHVNGIEFKTEVGNNMTVQVLLWSFG